MQVTQSNRKTIVDTDTRRSVFMLAKGRTKGDVAKVPHEAFIRQALKAKLGWAKNEPAPEHVKTVAKELAAVFNAEMLAASARVRALAEAEAKRKADMEADIAKMDAAD
jgi:hypothetical protein